ncbi:MAG: recombinase family protein [Pseudomonadota bacterium]
MTSNGKGLLGRVAVYTRVSTEEQARQHEGSLDNQIHRCKQYLASVGHDAAVVENLRLYREEGFSGKDTARPEFQRLVRDVRAGRISLLVFSELSRISRSVSDFLVFARLLDAHGVQFVSLRERFDTSSPQGNLIIIILMALAQFERETTSIRTRLAMRDRAQRGLWNGGPIPMGYEPVPGVSGHLRVVEDEALVIGEAYRVYLETGSLAETCRRLADAGLRRRDRVSRRDKHHKGKHLTWSALSHILKNPVYVGMKEVNRANRDLPDDEAIALPEGDRYYQVPTTAWEPIIDVETFERAGELLAENRARTANTIGPKRHDYVLTGIIRCGDCGVHLEGASVPKRLADGTKRRYFYYRHPGKRPDACTMSAGISAEKVEQAILDRLHRLADDPDLLARLVEKANQRIEDGVPAKEKELAVARAQVSRLHSEHQALVERLLAAPTGMVPQSFWEKAKDLEAQAQAAEGLIARLEAEVASIRSSRLSVQTYRATLLRFREVYDQLDALQQSDLLAYLLDAVEVTGSTIRIALLGEPEAGRLDAFTGGPRLGQPMEWLPLLDLNQRHPD